MKLLFLDIDGVLNSTQAHYFWTSRRNQEEWENKLYREGANAGVSIQQYLTAEFCPIAVNNLERLLTDFPDLKIVISSSWRIGQTLESMKEVFSCNKLNGKFFVSQLIADRIIGMTPSMRSQRGEEILKWLHDNDYVNYEDMRFAYEITIPFVILDDDDDMDSVRDNFFQTDGRVGFDFITYEKVKAFLKDSNE